MRCLLLLLHVGESVQPPLSRACVNAKKSACPSLANDCMYKEAAMVYEL